MPVAVVKLGSSVVAQPSGELRLSVVARVCEEVASLHRAGVDVVVVTSGAIARGVHLLALPVRPAEIAELQAASAMGQGRLYRTYDDLLREQGVATAQILLTFFDMSARTHYLNARRTLQTLLGWRVVPVINENDTTTTDEISFGDNDFLAAQVAVLLGAQLLLLLTDTDGLYTANPRVDPGAKLVEEVADPTQLGGARDRPRRLAARLGRDALEGRGGGDGHRRGDPDGDRLRPGAGRAGGGVGGRARRHAVRAPGGAPLQLQAVAEVREAGARDADRRRRRGAGAARRRDLAPAGRDRRRRRRVRRRRRRRGARGRARAGSARGSSTTRRPSCAA